MKRWKLWTAIASSVLSVGSGTTYMVWQRPVAAVVEAAEQIGSVVSPHSEPPRPIPSSSAAWSSPATEYVSPASFDANPPRGQTDPATGNGEPVPVPSRYGPPRGIDFGSSFGTPPASVPEEPANRAAFSDEPVAESPAPSDLPPEPAPLPDLAVSAETVSDHPRIETPPDLQPAPPAVIGTTGTPPPDPVTLIPVPAPSNPVEPSRPFAGFPATGSAAPGSRIDSPSSPSLLRDAAPIPVPSEPLKKSPAADSVAPLPIAGVRTPRRDGGPEAIRTGEFLSSAPGDRALEGQQVPSLSVERSAPEEIRVGAPARFVIRVRNTGQIAAQDVLVSDRVPQGTRFLSSTPEASPAPDGSLTWELGALGPEQVSTITVELMPEAEGEIGSVAAVTFRTLASVRTIATRPMLKVEHTGPAKTLIGGDIPLQITVSNPGSGTATGVVIEVDVPEGLSHDGGREIMSDRFDLRPNETRQLDLVLRAVEPGPVQTLVRAVGDDNLAAEHRGQLEVIAPQLQLSVVGPTRRFLDRPVKYQVPISNSGTAAARELELVARLPRGLKFVAADKKGQYDSQQHAVFWSVEELPAGEQGVVELTALPTDAGEQKLRIEARAALAKDQQFEHTTMVEDITDLVFTVTDENIPIEVGSDTTYQIRVSNNGTKAAGNIRLVIQAPAGLEIIDFDGPANVEQQGDKLLTQPIAELGQGQEAVFRISAKGTKVGDHVLRVQLMSDEFSTPVTKEEITKVYADQ